MNPTLQMVKQGSATQLDSTPRTIERPLSTRQLFCGQDEAGRRGWFLRLEVTGLYARRVGPFPTRAAALDCVDDLLAEIIIGPLLDLQNDLVDESNRRYVIEGVKTLTGRTKGR
jgi:hypothetical protein